MNGIIVIDKAPDWTSHDVVAKLRGLLKEKRVGHGGTLDPMATGVLPIFVGRATRAVEFCESADKEYLAGLRLGIATDTQDTTGTILSRREVSVTQAALDSVLVHFTGPQAQLPPMYSAVKIGGKKLYELARRGIEAERTPRQIEIKHLDLLDFTGSDVLLRVVCTKGTYIRTLCHDIGAHLGCGGAMFSLRRTRAGLFELDDAYSLVDISEASENGTAASLLKPVDALFENHPALTIDSRVRRLCLNGNSFPCTVSDGLYRVYDESHTFLLLGQAKGGQMHTVKSFFEVSPAGPT